jgi:ATP-dependent Lon protease
LIPSENKKDLAEIPPKVRQRIHFTMVDTMEQVIDAALLDVPTEPENHRQDEVQKSQLPVLLNGDERIQSTREQTTHRPVLPDEENENEPNEHRHDPLLLPPADHRIPGNSYPQVQAHDK